MNEPASINATSIPAQSIATRAVHAGRTIDSATGAVTVPIHLSTTFERTAGEEYPSGYFYSTFDNPNRNWLEQAIAELEGGESAIATSSGMAAIGCVLGSLRKGDRLLAAADLFQGTARLLNDQCRQWGIEASYADMTCLEKVRNAIRPDTKLIWIDTPSNPLLRVSDIEAISELAHSHNIKVVVDSTLATFVLQRPLTLGADIVIHAATKFIAGHSDVVSGLAVFRERGELFERARAFQTNLGLVPSPFDCWLVHRGLPTLPTRVRQQCESAMEVADFLKRELKVRQVYYPGLAEHPENEIAQRQMDNGYGGVVSFVVSGGSDAATKVVGKASLFTRATSLGGFESLIEHRSTSPIQTRGSGTGYEIPRGLIRLSIGLEDSADLIRDLARMFKSI